MKYLHRKRNIFYPLFTFLGFSLGIILIWRSIYTDNIEELQNQAYIAAEQVAIRLEEKISSHLAAIKYLRREWQNGTINEVETFEQHVLTIKDQFGGFQAINYIDPQGYIRWVVPEESNLPAKDKDLHLHPSAAEFFIKAESTGNDVVTRPVDLWQGGRGFATYFPIIKDGQNLGYLNGVFRINHFIEYSLRQGAKDKFYFIIVDDTHPVYSYTDNIPIEQFNISSTYEISVLDRLWKVTIFGKPALMATHRSIIKYLIPVFSLIIPALIAVLVRILVVRRTEFRRNLILLEESQKKLHLRSKHREQLLETARQLTSSLELDSVLKLIVSNASKLLDTFSCVLSMISDDKKYLKPVVAIDPEYEKEIMTARVDIDSSYSGKAFKSKTSLVFNSVDDEDEGFLIPGTSEGTNERIIASPLIIDDEAIGVVLLNREGAPFDEDDLRLADTFAIYASTAIRNAQIHDRLLTEIKERTGLENQLRQAQKMEAIGQLAGGVAHDFNNKLGGIMGYAELALYDVENTDLVANNLKNILDRCEKAGLLVQQLLAFSRQQVLNFKTLDLNAVVSNSVNLLQNVIGENIELSVELDDALKTIVADLTAVDQIILNLCINARDAMPNGGKMLIQTTNVQLDASFCRNRSNLTAGEYVKLVVQDTGSGIDKEIMERIFDPFFTTKEVDEGTGLGLSMVFGLIKQHESHIECKSEPDQGTTFIIHFPHKTSGEVYIEDHREKPVKGGTETILLVEDDKYLLEIISSTLAKLGYRIIVAKSGQEGLGVYNDNAAMIALVITDVVMPGMNGLELHNEIAGCNGDLKFLFITGYGPESMLVKQSYESGVDILQKPFRHVDLAAKVRDLLD